MEWILGIIIYIILGWAVWVYQNDIVRFQSNFHIAAYFWVFKCEWFFFFIDKNHWTAAAKKERSKNQRTHFRWDTVSLTLWASECHFLCYRLVFGFFCKWAYQRSSLIGWGGGGGGVLAALVQHKRIFLFMFSVHFLFSPILNKPAAHLTVFCFEWV